MGNPMTQGAFGAALLAFALAMTVTIGSGGADPSVPWGVVKQKGSSDTVEITFGFAGFHKQKPEKGDESIEYSKEDEKADDHWQRLAYMCAEKGDEEASINLADGKDEKKTMADHWYCKCKAQETTSVALWAVTAAMAAIAAGALGARAFAADSQILYLAAAACSALAFIFAMAATINYEVNCMTPMLDQWIRHDEKKEMEKDENGKAKENPKDEGSGAAVGMILGCISIVFFAAATGISAVAKPEEASAPASKPAEPAAAEAV